MARARHRSNPRRFESLAATVIPQAYVSSPDVRLLGGEMIFPTRFKVANVDGRSYDSIADPLHFRVNDVGMVFFFALAAKEGFETTLPGKALASPRRALSPLAAAVGGMTVLRSSIWRSRPLHSTDREDFIR